MAKSKSPKSKSTSATIGFEQQIWDAACELWGHIPAADYRKISCLVVAVLLHGIYDFFAGFSGSLRWFAIAVVLMAMIECRIKYTSLKTEEDSTN